MDLRPLESLCAVDAPEGKQTPTCRTPETSPLRKQCQCRGELPAVPFLVRPCRGSPGNRFLVAVAWAPCSIAQSVVSSGEITVK